MDNAQIHNFERWIKRFQIQKTGIVHVGAHLAEERDLYKDMGFEPVLWVEAIPNIAKEAERLLADYPSQNVVATTLWSSSGQKKAFFVSSNEGSSSSILPLHLHKSSHPEVVTSKKIEVTTTTLEELLMTNSALASKCKILILDTQGTELEVLIGGKSVLDHFDYILTEVSIRQLYKGSALHKKLKAFLTENNFLEVAHNINRESGWGDAFFIKKSRISSQLQLPNKQDLVFRGRKIAPGIHFRNLLVRIGIPTKSFTRERILNIYRQH